MKSKIIKHGIIATVCLLLGVIIKQEISTLSIALGILLCLGIECMCLLLYFCKKPPSKQQSDEDDIYSEYESK